MNPAIVAAALNQWGLLNGMQGQGNNDQVSQSNDNSFKTLSLSLSDLINMSSYPLFSTLYNLRVVLIIQVIVFCHG